MTPWRTQDGSVLANPYIFLHQGDDLMARGQERPFFSKSTQRSSHDDWRGVLRPTCKAAGLEVECGSWWMIGMERAVDKKMDMPGPCARRKVKPPEAKAGWICQEHIGRAGASFTAARKCVVEDHHHGGRHQQQTRGTAMAVAPDHWTIPVSWTPQYLAKNRRLQDGTAGHVPGSLSPRPK